MPLDCKKSRQIWTAMWALTQM